MDQALDILSEEVVDGREYSCDECGACCKQLVVEADHTDVVREPRLLAYDQRNKARGRQLTMAELATGDRCVLLACVKPCGLLEDNLCSVYPTRPHECVAFEAGSPKCQMAREHCGLAPLEACGR